MSKILSGVSFLILVALQSLIGHAQSSPQQNSPFSAPEIAPASFTTASRVLSNPVVPGNEAQIRIDVLTLVVDKETRSQIYSTFEREEIKTRFYGIDSDNSGSNLTGDDGELHLQNSVKTPLHVTTCILDDAKSQSIITQINEAPHSAITHTPRVILIDGNDAQLDDLVQRPFMVDAKHVAHGDRFGVEPVVKVFEHGTTIRLKAKLRDDESIRLTSEIASKKVLSVEHSEIYGIDNQATRVQIPRQQTKTVGATEVLAKGQSMLIDPYTKQTTRIEKNGGIPILDKIPYVNRSFKNTSSAELDTYIMFLLQPAVQNASPSEQTITRK